MILLEFFLPVSVRLPHTHHHGNRCLSTHLQVDLERSDPGGAAADHVAAPVLPELLIPETVDDRAHEARDDVDHQKEDVPDFQPQAREEGDERCLQRRNHEGQHAEQQLQQKKQMSFRGLRVRVRVRDLPAALQQTGAPTCSPWSSTVFLALLMEARPAEAACAVSMILQ